MSNAEKNFREEVFASLFISFGRSNGAESMIQGQRRVIDDLNESVDYALSDDTGMNAYEFNASNDPFPLSLYFKNRSAQDIAQGLKSVLDLNGFKTEDTPVSIEEGKFRVMPFVFVENHAGGVLVSVPDLA